MDVKDDKPVADVFCRICPAPAIYGAYGRWYCNRCWPKASWNLNLGLIPQQKRTP